MRGGAKHVGLCAHQSLLASFMYCVKRIKALFLKI